MLTFSPSQPALEPQDSIAVIGIGGTGTHIVNRLKPIAPDGLRLITLNSGSQLIKESIADASLALGSSITRGLSCGGDPDLGRKAAEAGLDELDPYLAPGRLVFLIAGLGGGTGSGAAPVVARKIREAGAFLVVFATTPFSFEGSRRLSQSRDALNELALYTNILLTFENDRMGELIAAEKGVQEAFSAADALVAESVAALSRISLKPGLISLGLADIAAVLGNNMGRCLFGFGSASGNGRTKNALLQALACPLLSQRDALSQAPDVLVHISGGHDLTLAEIESLMKELSTHLAPASDIHFGISIDGKMEGSLALIILTGLPTAAALHKKEEVVIIDDPHLGEQEEEPAPPVFSPPPVLPKPIIPPAPMREPVRDPFPEMEPPPGDITEPEPPAPKPERPPVETSSSKEAAPTLFDFNQPRKSAVEEQSELTFSRSVKGKFAGEQSDLVDGEDLDLPPALRKKRPLQ